MLSQTHSNCGLSKPKLKLKSDMAKVNWELVNIQFQRDQQRTGITMAEWCEQNNYNYQTARRYLKRCSQLPSGSETFHVATPNEQLECAKTAQIGVKTAQEWNAQKTAQIDNAQSGKASSKKGDAKSTLVHSHTESVEASPADHIRKKKPGNPHPCNLFKPGNPGNPNPPKNFKPGNQAHKKHLGYAKFLPSGKFDEAREMRLRDELILTRAQVICVVETIQNIENDIKLAAGNPEVRADLYRTLLETQNTLDRRIARVESLTRTLSTLQLDKVNVPRIVAETDRSRAVTRKSQVETRMMEREEGGDTTPIGDIISEIQSMGSGGLMSGPTGNETDNHG